MSGFIQGGRKDGIGANRVERQRAGTAESIAPSRARSSETNRGGATAALERPASASFAATAGRPGRWRNWQQRFARRPASAVNAHRALERTQRLEQILSIRQARTVAADHTVSWQGQRWGLWREDVCAGLRGARVEIERRLDGSHWLRFRGRYMPLHPCPAAQRSATPSGLRPTGVADQKTKSLTHIKTKSIPSPDHPWRKPWKRTFLFCRKPDISTLR
jgi:hypothetical protein